MEYLNNHNKIEYGGNSTSIFSGGLNAQGIIKDNYIISNIQTNENYDRFKDLHVPVGLQISKYTVTTMKPNKIICNENVVSEKLYDRLYDNIKTKTLPKNPLNKSEKNKKVKKNKNKSRKKGSN
tara:strand:+ start:150 stop:521 length:372 start_codon:yes stop_codon:yes gene_type:complete